MVDCTPAPSLRFDIIDARTKQLGLNKGQLAERVGVDDSTMWRYRRGLMRPTLPVLARMRDVLGLSIDAMTGARGQTNDETHAGEDGK